MHDNALLDYIDTKMVTVSILKDYLDQKWKLEQGQEIERLNTKLEKPQGSSIIMPLGEKHDRQEEICGIIDKIDIARRGYKKAMSYHENIEPAWNRLTDEEQYVLATFYIENDDNLGIKRIMEKLNIEKSGAYNLKNKALARLSKLLFW